MTKIEPRHTTNWIGWFLAFMIASIWITCTYWLFWPYNPIEVRDPIKVLNPNKIVKAGEDLIYEISYTKKIESTGKIDRQLINSYVVLFPSQHSTMPMGTGLKRVVRLQVPQATDPGKYRLLWSITYEVNPLRHITHSVYSECFTVER